MAVSKGNAMFHGNRVQACSVTVKDNSIYFTGIVGAAMKNEVTVSLKHSYILYISIRAYDQGQKTSN